MLFASVSTQCLCQSIYAQVNVWVNTHWHTQAHEYTYIYINVGNTMTLSIRKIHSSLSYVIAIVYVWHHSYIDIISIPTYTNTQNKRRLFMCKLYTGIGVLVCVQFDLTITLKNYVLLCSLHTWISNFQLVVYIYIYISSFSFPLNLPTSNATQRYEPINEEQQSFISFLPGNKCIRELFNSQLIHNNCISMLRRQTIFSIIRTLSILHCL